MNVIETQRQHLLEVKLGSWDEPERVQGVDMVVGLPQIDEVLTLFARTLEHEGRPLACFGVWPVWAGVGRAWSMISEEARRSYPKSLYKAVRANLAVVEERNRLGRIEATVRFGHPSAHGWIRHLGFNYEGLMRNYGIGCVADFHLYARTRAWPL